MSVTYTPCLLANSNREYKDVEERHRVKMIEYETTNIVVGDLDKYYDALDKALLRYHGMKINDINKSEYCSVSTFHHLHHMTYFWSHTTFVHNSYQGALGVDVQG